MRLVLLLAACLGLLGCGDGAPECSNSGPVAVQYLGSQQSGTCALFGSEAAVQRALADHPVIHVEVSDCYYARAAMSYVDGEGCQIDIDIYFEGDSEQETTWDRSNGGFDVTASCGADTCLAQGVVFL